MVATRCDLAARTKSIRRFMVSNRGSIAMDLTLVFGGAAGFLAVLVYAKLMHAVWRRGHEQARAAEKVYGSNDGPTPYQVTMIFEKVGPELPGSPKRLSYVVQDDRWRNN